MTALAGHVAAAREAQARWREAPLRERLRVIGRVRPLIARDGLALARAASAGSQRPLAEKLTTEVIPLAAACAFLEREAARVLRARVVRGRGRPIWLAGVRSEVRREPFGVALVVGPANYPLFLPGVQTLQALAAGNAVLLKPGRAGTEAAERLARLCTESGLPASLLHVLPEPVEVVHEALAGGVDLVVFTGSSEAGRAVLAAAAPFTIPVIAELSGDDAFLVRRDADPELASQALRFGRELNGGDSCIAPRRVSVDGAAAGELRARFSGAEVAVHADDEAALRGANSSPYGLGATIISRDEKAALALASRLQAGVVVINDCLMPTADPRLPFGGTGASGFGVTRGPEGLLAMTRPKVVITQRGARRHLAPAHPGDEEFFMAYLRAAHGGSRRGRWRAWLELLQRAAARGNLS